MDLLITATVLMATGTILATWDATSEYESPSGFGSGLLTLAGLVLGVAGFGVLVVDFVWRSVT